MDDVICQAMMQGRLLTGQVWNVARSQNRLAAPLALFVVDVFSALEVVRGTANVET